jgi:serine/threonine protein kinase
LKCFAKRDRLAKISAITNLDYPIRLDRLEDPLIADTLKICLEKDPDQRAEVGQLLRHQFLRISAIKRN